MLAVRRTPLHAPHQAYLFATSSIIVAFITATASHDRGDTSDFSTGIVRSGADDHPRP